MTRYDKTDTGRGQVVSLACARFEDALAEGELDAAARRHRDGCARCAELEREMALVGELIADATAPRELPAGFADAIFDRASVLDADVRPRPMHTEPAPLTGQLGAARSWRAVALGGAVAAGLILAFWAGGLVERQSADREAPAVAEGTQSRMVSVAPDAGQTPEAPPQVAQPAPRRPTPVPVVLRPQPQPQPAVEVPAVDNPHPVVPDAVEVPEPKVDLTDEVRAILLSRVARIELCPKHSQGVVRATITLDASGKLTHRQVLSYAGHRDAHQCINYALDQLILPPLDGAADLTLDLTW